MADVDLQTPADATAVTAAEQTAAARPKKSPRVKKVVAAKVAAPAAEATKPKTRGLSVAEKLERIGQIEAQVAGGATLKDAVKTVGISDQTFYQWKKAVSTTAPSKSMPSKAAPKIEAPVMSGDDEIAEFIELEQENRRLRKLLSEKLKTENADLRKRLGL